MAERWVCTRCRSPWAAGAPCCPQCRSTEHVEDTEDGMRKIDRNGRVTDSADVAALTEELEHAEAEIAELEAKQPAPAGPVPSPEPPAAAPAPVPPRPPRRTPPPAVPRE